MAKGLMSLRIEATESGGYELWLDDKLIRGIEGYKIESRPVPSKGLTDLTIKMAVRYPVREGAGCEEGCIRMDSAVKPKNF